jgi:Mrp family chromosome partitioning ATPase
VPHGAILNRASEVMLTADIGALMEELSSLADYVIVDTPPVLVAADAYPILHAADTVLVTVREGVTKRSAADAATETFDVLGLANRLVVLNGTGASQSYGYYGYLEPGAARDERRRLSVVDRATTATAAAAEKDAASESAS